MLQQLIKNEFKRNVYLISLYKSPYMTMQKRWIFDSYITILVLDTQTAEPIHILRRIQQIFFKFKQRLFFKHIEKHILILRSQSITEYSNDLMHPELIVVAQMVVISLWGLAYVIENFAYVCDFWSC